MLPATTRAAFAFRRFENRSFFFFVFCFVFMWSTPIVEVILPSILDTLPIPVQYRIRQVDGTFCFFFFLMSFFGEKKPKRRNRLKIAPTFGKYKGQRLWKDARCARTKATTQATHWCRRRALILVPVEHADPSVIQINQSENQSTRYGECSILKHTPPLPLGAPWPLLLLFRLQGLCVWWCRHVGIRVYFSDVFLLRFPFGFTLLEDSNGASRQPLRYADQAAHDR